jgi:threonine/homoserine/homoserine lactone efflux protein
MSTAELALATAALLATPGPTNTLVLIAGAERGLWRALRLIPADLAGYFLTVLPLVLAGAAMPGAFPGLHALVALAAAARAAVLAVRLWGLPDAGALTQGVDAGAIFVTTALTPKALIFGLVVLPSPDDLATNLMVFAALAVAVATLWSTAGAVLRDATRDQPLALGLVRRLASHCLGAISVVLVLRSVGA